MPKPFFVLVTGATGNQGSLVARRLLERGHRVRILTRKPESAKAQQLKKIGAEIAQGDFNDSASLERAMRDVSTVFAMGTPENGVAAEVRQGMNLANVAKDAGIAHYIYSSVIFANRDTGVPFFDSKARIERHIRDIHLPYTIVGPAYFMENVFEDLLIRKSGEKVLELPLPGLCKVQQLALVDLAEFVSIVVEDPERLIGRRFDIASDELSGIHAAEAITEASGVQIDYSEKDIDDFRLENPELADLATMYDWLNHSGTDINIETLRYQFPEVRWHRYEQWCSMQDWAFLKQAKAA